MFENTEAVDVKVPLIQAEIDVVAGGRFKRPLQRPITVYYDDGISIVTSDPLTTNVHPNIT